MKKKRCAQCNIANLYLKNETNEIRLIFVLEDNSIVPAKEEETLEGFDIETIYCLGCSWSGSVKRLKK